MNMIVSYDDLNSEQRADLMICNLEEYKSIFSKEIFNGLATLCIKTINSLDDSEMKKHLEKQYKRIIK